jgi:hypothetical protein
MDSGFCILKALIKLASVGVFASAGCHQKMLLLA